MNTRTDCRRARGLPGWRTKALGCAVAALALVPSAAIAGAWTLPENIAQILMTATASRADKAFDAGSTIQATPRYSKYELQALMEYRVSDWLTAIVSPGLQHVDIAAPTSANRTGFGTSEFGARVRLWHGELPGASWVASGQVTLRVPGTFDTGNPAAVGYTGFEADLRALFGVGFAIGGWPAFVDLQVAQRLRGGGPADEARFDTTFGVRPTTQWLLLAQVFNVWSEGAGNALFPATHYHKAQLSLAYSLMPDWWIQAGAFTTFAGRNALQENGLIVGFGCRFDPRSAFR